MNKEKDFTSIDMKTAESDISDILKSFIRPNVDECFNDIKRYVEMCEKDRQDALDKVAEWNKDEEIQKLKEEIEDLKHRERKGISFVVSEEELAEINAWQNEHINKYHGGDSYAGAIGGRFSYKFIPTSIGDIGYVYCDFCKKNHKVKKEERCFCFREL